MLETGMDRLYDDFRAFLEKMYSKYKVEVQFDKYSMRMRYHDNDIDRVYGMVWEAGTIQDMDTTLEDLIIDFRRQADEDVKKRKADILLQEVEHG